jgi:type II secretory pathway pseudopilin PulG
MKIFCESSVEPSSLRFAAPGCRAVFAALRRAKESRVFRLGGSFGPQPSTFNPQPVSGFTMVEIAISLAVIGIALVAIIGVLPIGMNTQRDNREETIINQDATVFIEAIRGGARGLDDLTNYVYAITNYWTLFNAIGSVKNSGVNGYTYTAAFAYGTSVPFMELTNGANIVGLLSTPEYVDSSSGLPIPTLIYGGYSNHVVAYVRSISGPAIEKPPQNNDIIVGDSFGYRILCVNAPVVTDMTAVTNAFGVVTNVYFKQLAANLHELRLTFLWPQQPNGNLGPGRQTFRTMVAGQIVQTYNNGQWLYFYQSQSFVNVTNAP